MGIAIGAAAYSGCPAPRGATSAADAAIQRHTLRSSIHLSHPCLRAKHRDVLPCDRDQDRRALPATASAGRRLLPVPPRHRVHRGVKSRQAVRDLPVPETLKGALAAHLPRTGPGPAELVFSGDCQRYGRVRAAWDRVCQAAGIAGATIHDARHTYAVHAAQAGVPIVRLQKLLGHSTPLMTLRYMRHAPEAYLDDDAAEIAAHMAGAGDQEAAARTEAARQGMRQA